MAAKTARKNAKIDPTVADRIRRMKWWHDARLGMFIHFGLYSQLGRGEWVMNRERIPVAEYETLADTFAPRRGAPLEWARLARDAGMGYMVMTTKHHEGFCLWNSSLTDYNAARRGPKRDIVAEYVDACRKTGLKVGFYYSLMDWHHGDGLTCTKDESARRRFLDYTHGLVEELMTRYGRVDILWYDIPLPLDTPEKWESAKLNAMVRRHQPNILINDRSYLPEDFGTSEGHSRAHEDGRAWEACTTTANGWGYMETPAEEWMSGRRMVRLLADVLAGAGNLLLNIGPKGDGAIPEEAAKQFRRLGRWAAGHEEVVYGPMDRRGLMEGTFCGQWTRRGKTGYYWLTTWPGSEVSIGGFETKVRSVRLVTGVKGGSKNAKPLPFTQTGNRFIVRGLPKANPDKVVGIPVLRFDFADVPTQRLGPCMEPI